MQGKNITILFCPPGSKPQIKQIKNDIETFETLVEGPIGVKVLEEDGLCLIFNDMGDRKALDINRVIQGDPIFGACIFCRINGENFTSLREDEIQELQYLLS